MKATTIKHERSMFKESFLRLRRVYTIFENNAKKIIPSLTDDDLAFMKSLQVFLQENKKKYNGETYD